MVGKNFCLHPYVYAETNGPSIDENDEVAEVVFEELEFTVFLVSRVEVRTLNCVTCFFELTILSGGQMNGRANARYDYVDTNVHDVCYRRTQLISVDSSTQ